MIKVENWNGHEIRFVEKAPGDWWAVLADIAKALNLQAKRISERLSKGVVSNDLPENGAISKYPILTKGGIQEMLIVNERGIYKTIFHSRKPEAEAFQDWACDVIVELRRASALEGFQIFRMLDKEHQREAMARLRNALPNAGRVNYIKANTIADKAVSNAFGLPKMIGKEDMTPEMLVRRQAILDDTVNLMSTVERFGLDVSVSQKIYQRHH